LATLRPDGFAGYEVESKDKSGFVTTKEIPYTAGEIRISADVEDGGSIKVSLIDKNGREIAKAQEISKTVTDEPLKWNNEIEPGKIRFKFQIMKSKVYSFSFK
jgi:hypothetical protein